MNTDMLNADTASLRQRMENCPAGKNITTTLTEAERQLAEAERLVSSLEAKREIAEACNFCGLYVGVGVNEALIKSMADRDRLRRVVSVFNEYVGAAGARPMDFIDQEGVQNEHH